MGNGRIYQGEVLNKEGKIVQHGVGVQENALGDIYNGDWVVGKKHGNGQYTFSNGDSYNGEFKNDLPCGIGVYKGRKNSSYVGSWRDGKRNGEGIQIYKDGGRYSGNFKDDERHGYGTMVWPDGSKYEGHWSYDGMHGHGKLVLDSVGPNIHEGNWINGFGKGQDFDLIYNYGQSRHLQCVLRGIEYKKRKDEDPNWKDRDLESRRYYE